MSKLTYGWAVMETVSTPQAPNFNGTTVNMGISNPALKGFAVNGTGLQSPRRTALRSPRRRGHRPTAVGRLPESSSVAMSEGRGDLVRSQLTVW